MKLPPRQAPKESLNPRMLTKAPTSHVGRTAILKKLHGAMTAQNEKLRKDKNSANRCFILTPDELVTMALDEEEKTAKDNPGVYGNVIKLRIVKVTKMSIGEWVKEVMDHLNTRYYSIKPIQKPGIKPNPEPNPLATGMTVEEELAIVPHLVTPLTGHEQYGYVTKAPTESEIAVAKEGVDKSNGWEKCDRCGSRFQVFPGRREDGVLATGGACTYHPSRPLYPPRKKTDHVTGTQEPYYPCCSEPMGTSTGCTKSDSHVFKVSETKRLASVLQFETTPQQPEKGPLDPVCVDCEMGYTSIGMELIRLTAVSWPEGRDLLDVLVRPIGEMLDFNSRFSGVFQKDYIDAKPYGTPVTTADLPTKEGEQKPRQPLQLVKSPAEARDQLFKLLQPETPLIGHAIDNDLNVCRIIHPTVIDTVLLFPHTRGLPIRNSLKYLASKHLGRDIQTGVNGHDSKEDSVTTGDLVRVKVREKWKELNKNGWKLENGKLIPPGQGASKSTGRTG
jgi:DNA polymerase III epsilon subunit-like protein